MPVTGRGAVLVVPGRPSRGLLCGIRSDENRSVLRTGFSPDTSPLEDASCEKIAAENISSLFLDLQLDSLKCCICQFTGVRIQKESSKIVC